MGFQLFFSFDYAGSGAWPKSTVIDYLTQYGSNTAYYHYNGKPFVSTFEGAASAAYQDGDGLLLCPGLVFARSKGSAGGFARRARWSFLLGRMAVGDPTTWTPTWMHRTCSIWTESRT
jgi:hypothetical protein